MWFVIIEEPEKAKLHVFFLTFIGFDHDISTVLFGDVKQVELPVGVMKSLCLRKQAARKLHADLSGYESVVVALHQANLPAGHFSSKEGIA